MEDNYRKFVQGYIALCEETGYLIDVTALEGFGVYLLDKDDNREDFSKQIEELNTP